MKKATFTLGQRISLLSPKTKKELEDAIKAHVGRGTRTLQNHMRLRAHEVPEGVIFAMRTFLDIDPHTAEDDTVIFAEHDGELIFLQQTNL